jgi:hypothetical protein
MMLFTFIKERPFHGSFQYGFTSKTPLVDTTAGDPLRG